MPASERSRLNDYAQVLDDGLVVSGSNVARQEGLHLSTVNELLPLTLPEPVVIQSILAV